jgi:hypothetical protein
MLRDRSILNPAKPEANGFFNRELETGDWGLKTVD